MIDGKFRPVWPGRTFYDGYLGVVDAIRCFSDETRKKSLKKNIIPFRAPAYAGRFASDRAIHVDDDEKHDVYKEHEGYKSDDDDTKEDDEEMDEHSEAEEKVEGDNGDLRDDVIMRLQREKKTAIDAFERLQGQNRSLIAATTRLEHENQAVMDTIKRVKRDKQSLQARSSHTLRNITLAAATGLALGVAGTAQGSLENTLAAIRTIAPAF